MSTKPPGGTRDFLPAGPFDVVGACPFVVHVDYLVNKEYAITFTDANGNPTHAIVQGDLVARFTNVSNGHSVTINISGPGRYDFGSDGSLLVTAWGNWTFPFVPGQLGAGAPGELILNQGKGFWEDLMWNDTLSYRDVDWQLEMQDNVYNFEVASTQMFFEAPSDPRTTAFVEGKMVY